MRYVIASGVLAAGVMVARRQIRTGILRRERLSYAGVGQENGDGRQTDREKENCRGRERTARENGNQQSEGTIVRTDYIARHGR